MKYRINRKDCFKSMYPLSDFYFSALFFSKIISIITEKIVIKILKKRQTFFSFFFYDYSNFQLNISFHTDIILRTTNVGNVGIRWVMNRLKGMWYLGNYKILLVSGFDIFCSKFQEFTTVWTLKIQKKMTNIEPKKFLRISDYEIILLFGC